MTFRKKKLIIASLVVVLILGGVGCLLFAMGAFDGMIINSRVQTIVKAIEEQNPDKIVDLFSQSVVEQVGLERLKEGADHLFTVIEGNVLSIEDSSVVSHREYKSGKARRFYKQTYYITTDIDVYWVSFIYYTSDRIEPKNKGMYQLTIQNKLDWVNNVLRDDFIGIYVPPIVDEYDNDISHKYEASFGTFIMPNGYYKEASQSSENHYYFTSANIDLSAVVYPYFSIYYEGIMYGLSDINDFHEENITKLNNLIKKSEYSGGDYWVEESYNGETKQGYPLQILSIYRNTTIMEKHFFIIGDRKFVQVKFKRFSGFSELEPYEQAMLEAAESVVNSFVWAE